MSRFRPLHSRIDSLFNLRNRLFSSQSTNSHQFHLLPSTSPTPSLKIEERIGPEIIPGKKNTPPEFLCSEAANSNGSVQSRKGESRNEDIVLKGKVGSKGSEKLTRKDALLRKELSPDMEMFVRHLYREGYFNYANFLPDNKLVLSNFECRHGRDFIKSAAQRFGRDNQEIAKWLSGSDLRKVAFFGCPSTAREDVFAAKRLRKFFRIQEDTVCHKCILRQSCKYVNQGVWNGDTKNLNLAAVLQVITQYALEAIPKQLIIPEDMKASLSRLLKEILKLSPTVSRN
ncbi:uncharacterized protein LOC120085986 [Benincasa hispida]|uniref:uncharacterized protein LOC120085986 n=1 Tax=Benincasa hispida TaxID=102211 RepID=UPI0019017495|nr:uncharacterized protein LOC120085986 [Benincasa hispida]